MLHKWTYLRNDEYQCGNCGIVATKEEITNGNVAQCVLSIEERLEELEKRINAEFDQIEAKIDSIKGV